jgi:hypothetical protein
MEFRFSVTKTEVGEIIVEADDYDQAALKAHDVYRADGTKWGTSEMSVHLERTYL